MFKGIVEEKGVVTRIQEKKNLLVLTLKANKVIRGTGIGDSIAVDGVCLTVVKKKNQELTFDIMYETIRKTTLKYLRKGSPVNCERALKVSSRIDGHFVQGHVDGVGQIDKKVTKENYVEFRIQLPKTLSPYLVSKGSVAVDGISLTVGEVKGNRFSVYIIPHTLEVTTLGVKKDKDKVNIETDILAKYILAQRKNPYSLART